MPGIFLVAGCGGIHGKESPLKSRWQRDLSRNRLSRSVNAKVTYCHNTCQLLGAVFPEGKHTRARARAFFICARKTRKTPKTPLPLFLYSTAKIAEYTQDDAFFMQSEKSENSFLCCQNCQISVPTASLVRQITHKKTMKEASLRSSEAICNKQTNKLSNYYYKRLSPLTIIDSFCLCLLLSMVIHGLQ